MSRHLQALHVGTTARRGSRFGRGTIVVFVLAGILGIGAPAAAADTAAVAIDPITTYSVTTATLTGSVTPDTEAVETYWFTQYAKQGIDHGENGEENWQFGPSFAGVSGGSTPIEDNLSGLSASTAYEARIGAVAFEGSAAGINQFSTVEAFTTDAAATAPTLTVDPPAAVSYTSAHISGEIDPEGGNEDAVAGPIPINWALETNREGEGWNQVAGGTIEGAEAVSDPLAGEGIVVEANLEGLTPDRTYQFRLVASYAGQEATPSGDEFDTLAVAAPIVSANAPDSVTSSSAHLSGTVEVSNSDPALDANCTFDYVRDTQFQSDGFASAQQSSCNPNPVTGPGSTPVEAAVTDLEPNTAYHLRLRAENAGGTDTDQAPGTFTTAAVAPEIGQNPIYELTQTTVTLTAFVNPHNSPVTECRFVYGISSAVGNEAPCESTPAGNSFQLTRAALSGLTPGADYRFKLVVATTAGSVEGEERAFHTPAPKPQESCPNQVIRGEQNSTSADCRAYEMVSPPDKNGGEVASNRPSTVAAADGNGIAYLARASFGDTTGSGASGQTPYVARRGPQGWQSHGVLPTPQYDALVTAGLPFILNYSLDLRNAVLWAYDLPAVTGDLPTPNIYAEDTLTGDLSLVTTPLAGPQSLPAMARDYLIPTPSGASDDSRHIAFDASTSRLLPEAPLGVPSVYEWDNGTLRLASVLPDGTPMSSGAKLASPNSETSYGYRYTVSPDGSRVLFLSPLGSEGQLYERVDHSRTVWISEPEGGSAPMAEEVVLQEVSGDSRHVIFTTTSRLLLEDANDGPDIYLYSDGPDPEHERNLTLVTDSGDVPGHLGDVAGTPVVGSSDDASRIYFYKPGRIFVWHNGEIRAASDQDVKLEAEPGLRFSATVSAPGAARVTPNGRFLAYLAFRQGAAGHGERSQLYLYDANSDQVRCVSCPAGHLPIAHATVTPNISQVFPKFEQRGSRPSFLAEDGRVFFSTDEALVPEDVNAVGDVYEFDPASGEVSLITSGKGAEPAAFVDAGSSGDDVFFVTRQPLVGTDRDRYIDLYDARAGGGFPEPPAPPTPCEGDACQGLPGLAPADRRVVSNLDGNDNVKPRRHHHRKHRCARKHNRPARARCGRKSHHKEAGHPGRAANTTQRAGK